MNIVVVSTLGYTQEAFLLPYIECFKNDFGAEIYSIANWNYNWGKMFDYVKKINIPFSRNILSPVNYLAIFKLIRIFREYNFDLIYTHTPIASMVVRLANKYSKQNFPILYEAHGFHFHQYQTRVNNFLFKNIEKFFSFYTDGIITINKDDFYMAKELFSKPDIFYVPGIGVDLNFFDYKKFDKYKIKSELGFSSKDKIIITIADFIKRKNLEVLVDIGASLKEKRKDWKWVIVGDGPLFNKINKQIQDRDMNDFFILAGYQSDVRRYIAASDIFILLSIQEGLPRSLLEAGAFKLPVVVTNIRGNRDVIAHGKNSYLVPPSDIFRAVEYLNSLLNDEKLRKDFGDKLYSKIKKSFSLDVALRKHIEIFERFLR